MNLRKKPYTLPNGKPFTEENYWQYIIKDLPAPWERNEVVPKKPKERVQVQPTTDRSATRLRQSKAKAKAQKAWKNG